MSIQINNSVNNINNTPGIISDIYANIPTANNVAIGTIFIATDTNTIYRSDGATWQTLGGGGGGVGTIDQVLSQGNVANGKQQIMSNGGYVNTIQWDQILIQDQTTYNWDSKLMYNGFELLNPLYNSARCFLGYDFSQGTYCEVINDSSLEFVNFVSQQRVTDLASGKFCGIDFGNKDNELSILPLQGGTLQSIRWGGFVDIDLNAGPYLLDPALYTGQQVFFTITGGPSANTLALRSYSNIEITLCIRSTPVQITTSTNPLFTMTLYGNPNINTPGLYKALFNQVNSTTYEVYISHT